MARRADAERNRAKILEAAAAVFGESGIDVPMSEVARRAEVGIATVMRNFPAREQLIEETFAGPMHEYALTAAAAAADPDAWHGFRSFLEYLVRVQSGSRGFNQVLTTMFPGAERLEAQRQAALRDFVRLVGRAKAAGRLRPDFSPHDLPLFLLATSSVVRLGDEAATARLVGYLMRACAAGREEPLPPAPEPRGLYEALEQRGKSP
ncbi:TetR/AcrR family transcriptional regulator [Actinoplanes sp. NPDC000266]